MTLIPQYEQMHAMSDEMFAGMSMMPHVKRIEGLVRQTESIRLIDYGCGKGKQWSTPVEGDKTLEQMWGVSVARYDPGYPPYAGRGVLDTVYDGAICTDVLEHAETTAEAIAMVQRLFIMSSKFVFASIACTPAIKHLPDGRNAHTCIQPAAWWAGVFEAIAMSRPDHQWKIVCRTANGEEVFTNG